MSDREEVMLKICTADAETLRLVLEVLRGNVRPSGEKSRANLRLVSIKETVETLGVARQTVYNLIKRGRLQTVNLNGVQRVREQSIIDFANGRTAGSSISTCMETENSK